MPQNEWRETVRDIFDLLISPVDGLRSEREHKILLRILESHKDFFCGPPNQVLPIHPPIVVTSSTDSVS